MLTPTRILRAKWTSTLHTPKSSFPPRLPPASTASYLQRCTDDFYSWQYASRSGAPFVLHDGPPYANGPLHIGHALNKITKDLICRFQVGQGKKVSYIPGWDCHGLPIEIKALQLQNNSVDLGTKGSPQNAVKVRTAAKDLANSTIKQQMKGFREWAVMGDWHVAYKTMDNHYEIRQLNIFKRMVEKGLIYRQYKPVYWSPSSATALAEAELEYDENHESIAAFIAFPAYLPSSTFWDILPPASAPANLHLVIWTTTPWTIPANKAIAVRKELEYSIVEDEAAPSKYFVIASSRVSNLVAHFRFSSPQVVATLLGSELIERVQYYNRFQGKGTKPQPIIHADFVTEDSGSGLVHLAPGHGMDDYNVCNAHGITAFAPVDDQGRFTHMAFPENPQLLHGQRVQKEGAETVCNFLNERGFLLWKYPFKHKYPVDWRTKKPLIIRATEQWFANVETIKERAMQALQKVNFVPEAGKSRLESFVQGRSQWCISRQRAWGVPIPALYRVDQEGPPKAAMDGRIIDHIIKILQRRGTDAWWTDPENDPAWVPFHLEGRYIRGRDTMDVWFDSGTSWSLLPERKDGTRADVYLEGTDQHRGWFQSSLLTHVAQEEVESQLTSSEQINSTGAPFRILITHGFTLDQDGRKMSKSLGNVISPDEIMSGTILGPVKPKKGKASSKANKQPMYDGLGADALRLWVASSDYTKDVTIGQEMLLAVNNALHKYRVTFKWLLGVLELKTTHDSQPLAETREFNRYSQPERLIDQLALLRLSQISREVHASYTAYEFHRGVAFLNKYITTDLSAFYFETLKDRIYTCSLSDRESAQRILSIIFYELCQMLAPICPILIEEVWDYIPASMRSVISHPARTIWTPFKYTLDEKKAENLSLKTRIIEVLGDAIKQAQESARKAKKIGSGLECDVYIIADQNETGTTRELLSPAMEEELAAIFVVSKVKIIREAGEWKSKKQCLAMEPGVRIPGDGEVSIVNVILQAPEQYKCERCWRFVAEEKGEICVRCEGVVNEEGGGEEDVSSSGSGCSSQ